MNFWMREKEEVEIVDFLIQVKDCMVRRGSCIWGYYCTTLYFGSRISVSQVYHLPGIGLKITISCATSSPQANALRHYPSVPSHTLQALQSQIRTIVTKLPEDLQSCLKPSFVQWHIVLSLIPVQFGNEAIPCFGSLTLVSFLGLPTSSYWLLAVCKNGWCKGLEIGSSHNYNVQVYVFKAG